MESISLKLHYGPYQAHGTIRHKKQRLHGLIELLNQENYTFELIPSPHLNRLTIDMMEREIFSCDIRYFLFNLPGDYDFICKKALLVIQEHIKLFYTAENRPKFSDMKEGMRMILKQEESTSFTTDLNYRLQMPQNSLISFKDWRCGESSDLCRKYGYTMYNLGSADLILDTHDSDEIQENISTTTTSKSGLLDDYWICDNSLCHPTCPPASLVQGELSSREVTKEEDAIETEEVEQTQDIEEMAKKIATKSEENNRIVKIMADDAIVNIMADDAFSENEEVLYKCKECGNCYCICD